MGDREVRQGPLALALHYNEKIEGYVTGAHILSPTQSLVIEAQADHDGKTAGDLWMVKGPARYIPSKYERIKQTVDAISINENQGIYVRNIETAELRLIKGPCVYTLGVREELYQKPWKAEERKALGLGSSSTHWATVIYLEKGEVMCVLDDVSNAEKLVLGPATYVFGPQDGVKVIGLSAGKPKVPNAIQAAKLRLGPDFMSDIFVIRTKDNAQLSMHLTYKRQFLCDERDAHKAFTLDFIGYACQTMCSKVREIAAQFNFEEFHSRTAQILFKGLFRDYELKDVDGKPYSVHGYYFEENTFFVSDIDIRQITPVNEDISNLLNQSIKSNMQIVCKKLEQAANVDAEKERVQAEAEIGKLNEGLIDIENENLKLESVEKAKIDGMAIVEKARAEKDAVEVKAMSKLGLDLALMKESISLLGSKEGRDYLELLRIQNFSQVEQQWYVSSSTQVQLPLGDSSH